MGRLRTENHTSRSIAFCAWMIRPSFNWVFVSFKNTWVPEPCAKQRYRINRNYRDRANHAQNLHSRVFHGRDNQKRYADNWKCNQCPCEESHRPTSTHQAVRLFFLYLHSKRTSDQFCACNNKVVEQTTSCQIHMNLPQVHTRTASISPLLFLCPCHHHSQAIASRPFYH